jgi:hypothetical protein
MIEIIDDGHGEEHIQEAEQLLDDIQRLCERQWLQKVRNDAILLYFIHFQPTFPLQRTPYYSICASNPMLIPAWAMYP